MTTEFAYPTHFCNEKMAIAFFKERGMPLSDGERIHSCTMQVFRNRQDTPLGISFMITRADGGRFEDFNFIDYLTWWDINKSKYIDVDDLDPLIKEAINLQTNSLK